MSDDIRIYVADLAAYNNGKLHGVWIDVTDELDDIQEQISAMLAESPENDAEEYAIHDSDGFGGYRVGEFESIEQLHEVACFIEEFPDFGGEILDHCCDLDEARITADDRYRGCYASLADFAKELTEDTVEVPDSLQHYIDYQRMAHDLESNGDVFTIEKAHDEVHVFWSH